MGSLLRTPAMRGYGDLVRELGGDPESFLARFGIPVGAEQQEDGFVAVDAFIRLLEASAEDLKCPDFGLRLSRFQGLDILGPIAVIARNAQTVLGGFEAIARYLYVHSPALTLTVGRASAESDVECTYEVTEPGVPYPTQSYELSMGIGAQILRLLGGPQARPRVVSFMHSQHGSLDAYRAQLGCPVRFNQTWNGFELFAEVADKRHRHRRSRDPTHRDEVPGIHLPAQYCRAVRTRGRTDQAAAAHRSMQRRGHRRPARAASADSAATTCRRGRALSRHHRR